MPSGEPALRILHISTRLILGGSQENTVLSCEGQSRRGHDVHLAFGPIYGPEGSLLDRVEAFNRRCASGEETTHEGVACRPITTHTVPDLIREVHPLRDFRCLGQLKHLIRDFKPDFVHTHSSKAGILGRWAAWKILHERHPSPQTVGAKPPASGFGGFEANAKVAPRHWPGIVHTIHGPPFMPIEGGLFKRLRRRLTNEIYEIAERSAARHCHIIVSVADAMTRLFLERHIGDPAQYVTVRSGIDTAPYLTAAPPPGEDRASTRAALGVRENDFVIGTIARLAEHKGHDDLLTALSVELKVRPYWKLLWVGDGWWRDRLIARAKELGLSVAEWDKRGDGPAPTSAQLLITGLIPPNRMPAHIRVMDLLAHPSYREGLPRTVPQALLCGVCPVAYDVDGTGEVCINNQTGRLVTLGDLAKFRQAIVDLAEDPGQRTTLAARGQKLCREQFSAEAMVNGLEQVYARAIALAERPR